MAISMSDKICNAAKEIMDKIWEEDFTTGYSQINPAIDCSEKKFSCSTYVAWVLHKVGFTKNQPYYGGVQIYSPDSLEIDLTKFCELNNFTKIESKDKLQKGDVVFVSKWGTTITTHPAHAFIFVQWAEDDTTKCVRYDGGSKHRADLDQPYTEYGDDLDYFLYAYRAPKSVLKLTMAMASATTSTTATTQAKEDQTPVSATFEKDDLTITGIRLPISDDIKEAPISVRTSLVTNEYIFNYDKTYSNVSLNGKCQYWLGDVVASDNQKMIICYNGSISDGNRITCQTNSLRPVLEITGLPDIEKYSVIQYLGKKWIVLDQNKLILKNAIGNYVYCNELEKGNAYENSDIKVTLENWLENIKA